MSEPVKMLEHRFNLFPARFSWRGEVYEVDAVNECKTVLQQTHIEAMYHFWVRCDGQMLHLCKSLVSDRWTWIPDEGNGVSQ